ncbi:MAG: N-acetylmuramoyl-L-alanine amidase [Spirochaetota bacterium]|nr:N-acetylmuramoyl-L-alanine amidase [Spirochaetota bacterium]
MQIEQRFISINKFSRPGVLLEGVRGIVVHWVDGAGQSAQNVVDYFEILGKQGQLAPYESFASAHFVVGLYGEILQCIPENEMAYHVGASAYTTIARKKLGSYPNNSTLGIEFCHPDRTGVFRAETLCAAAWLIRALLGRYKLAYGDIYRHFDITGKICPKYFAENEDAWREFLHQCRAIENSGE